jgi:XRE family transcriptional regulator, stress-response regulator
MRVIWLNELQGVPVVLLRKVIGDVLRARRLAQHRTLREVSTAANVSLGYLSEIERGHKEASSELLGAICEALGVGLSDVLSDVSTTFALAEQLSSTEALTTEALVESISESMSQSIPDSIPESMSAEALATEVTDGDVTVRVRSDGPLRTTLTAKRTPGPRHPESIFIG